MIRNTSISFNTLFTPSYYKSMRSTHINDDIYDRWHETRRINQGFVADIDDNNSEEYNEEDEKKLPKNTDMGYYYWIGKDYANAYVEDFKDIHEFSKDQFDREKVPRMPWRDQGCCIVGHAARDVARHFIQRWNQCKVRSV
jgi:phosphatidylserine/phosphatidylglycerophosphate/cardiolipin synthase-like enzyme